MGDGGVFFDVVSDLSRWRMTEYEQSGGSYCSERATRADVWLLSVRVLTSLESTDETGGTAELGKVPRKGIRRPYHCSASLTLGNT